MCLSGISGQIMRRIDRFLIKAQFKIYFSIFIVHHRTYSRQGKYTLSASPYGLSLSAQDLCTSEIAC